jgi:hypothetical protein
MFARALWSHTVPLSLVIAGCHRGDTVRIVPAPECPAGWTWLYTDHQRREVVCRRATADSARRPQVLPNRGPTSDWRSERNPSIARPDRLRALELTTPAAALVYATSFFLTARVFDVMWRYAVRVRIVDERANVAAVTRRYARGPTLSSIGGTQRLTSTIWLLDLARLRRRHRRRVPLPPPAPKSRVSGPRKRRDA